MSLRKFSPSSSDPPPRPRPRAAATPATSGGGLEAFVRPADVGSAGNSGSLANTAPTDRRETQQPIGRSLFARRTVAEAGELEEGSGVLFSRFDVDTPVSREPRSDAWHASHSDAVASDIARSHLAETKSSYTDLDPGRDERKKITEMEQALWNGICSLSITAADGTRWVGTGWLAGRRCVVTAGHCVYLHGHGGWAAEVGVHWLLRERSRCSATRIRFFSAATAGVDARAATGDSGTDEDSVPQILLRPGLGTPERLFRQLRRGRAPGGC